ncbi:ABC transporter permease [Micromonospora inyonensis]|uniref:Peptide/nickel transport system permease protein n=1 Tax=Micromonospora inyonensis TaxID=47866 RepID=A0A1C6RE90_9ACTN|nr:ABC transporter permease [Micromonospora inyonensis]SCL15364.1 peptide/nickel transport system permease protein [Micromonospora inyonensis]
MIARRLARTALLALAATAVVFAATEALPGDAGTLRDAGRASPEQVARAREQLGLDEPLVMRYLRWLGGLLQGDLGRSLSSGRPVSDLLGQRLPATISLVAAALAVTVLLTTAGLVVTHLCRGRGGTLAAGLAAVPQAVYAAALGALLSGMLGWLPAVSLLPLGGHPWQEPRMLLLPALALALPSAAFAGTLLRGVLTDTLRRPHVVDAYRRGLPPALVLRRHVLPFLAVPAIQVLALTAGWLAAGTALVETVYGFPGLGGLLVSAVAVRDVPVVQGAALMPVVAVLVGMLLADLAAAAVHRTARPAAARCTAALGGTH